MVAVFLLNLLGHVGSIDSYFSNASMLGGESARLAFPSRWSVFFWVQQPGAVRTVFTVGVVAHVAWLVGIFTPLAAVVSFGLWVSMVGRNPLLYGLPDQLHMAMAFLLMLLPAGRGFSLDARWRGRGRSVPAWCRGIIQLQLAVMYTATGLYKDGAMWLHDGTALYYALLDPFNHRFDIGEALAWLQPWLLRPLTWLVVMWEVAFGGFAAIHGLRFVVTRQKIPDLRPIFLGFGVLMHVGIHAMLYVAWFTPLVLACYLAFVTPVEARRGLAFIGRRRPG